MRPVGVARPRPCPATTPDVRPTTRGGSIPPTRRPLEDIVAVMREASDDRHGYRLRALIVVLWRGGLRVVEALALGERDLDSRRGSLLVRNGNGPRQSRHDLDLPQEPRQPFAGTCNSSVNGHDVSGGLADRSPRQSSRRSVLLSARSGEAFDGVEMSVPPQERGLLE